MMTIPRRFPLTRFGLNRAAIPQQPLLAEFQVKCQGLPEVSRQKYSGHNRCSEYHALFFPLLRNIRRRKGYGFYAMFSEYQRNPHW